MEETKPIELLKQMRVPFEAHSLVYNAGAGNNITAVELLLKAGMNANTKYEDQTGLEQACIAGNLDIIQLLLSNGANINAQNQSGLTPLMQAIGAGHANVVSELLQYNPNLDIRTKNGVNAMGCAAALDNKDIIALLKNAGGIELSIEEIKNAKQAMGISGNATSLFKGITWLAIIFMGWRNIVGFFLMLGAIFVNPAKPNFDPNTGNYIPATDATSAIVLRIVFFIFGFFALYSGMVRNIEIFKKNASEK